MSNTDDEKFVEKLLQDLPRARQMSPLEAKRFDKQIDLLVANEKGKNRNRRWVPQLSAAASVIILFAGVAVLTNNSGILNDTAPIVSPSKDPIRPNPVTSEETDPGIDKPDQPNSDTAKPKDDIGEYGSGESPKPDPSKNTVPVLRTGIDYEVNLDLVRSKVLPEASSGSLTNLSSAQIACTVELGIRQSLYALDQGVYMGEKVEAYYFGSSKTDLKIKIVSFGCNFVVELGLGK
jgi:hypothetical protein